MALPLLGPFRDLLAAYAGGVAGRAATTIATVFFAVVATAFVVAAGLVELTAKTGFPVAALVFAAFFAVLALVVYLFGRARSARRAARMAAAKRSAEADMALATKLARSTQPLLPLAAFLVAFVLARRE